MPEDSTFGLAGEPAGAPGGDASRPMTPDGRPKHGGVGTTASPARSDDGSSRPIVPALVVIGVLGVLLLVDPWRAGAFDDDWTYAWITRHLADTGTFAVNGWVAAMLGVQAAVGAACVRAFGPSADVLRVTTMVWHMAGVLAAYSLARKAGAKTGVAAFAAICIGLSPLSIPLSVSFMSDVPAMSGALICVAVAASAWDRAARGDRDRALLLLAAAAVVGLAAGTIRQVVWSLPLTMIALFAFDHRRDRRLVAAAGLIELTLAFAAWRVMHWYNSLPLAYTYDQVAAGLPAIIANPFQVLTQAGQGVLTMALVIAPASWALLSLWYPRWNAIRRGRAAIVVVVALIAVVSRPKVLLPPWLGNTITPSGVLTSDTCIGTRPELLPEWIRAIAMILAAAPFLCWFVRSPEPSPGEPLPAAAPGRRALVGALSGLSAATLLHLCLSGLMFDRYLMPVIAFSTIALPTHRLAALVRRPHPAGVAVFLLLCGYGVVTAHDYFELLRVRKQALDLVVSTGVPRADVCAGYELDGPFQLERAGHVDGIVTSLRVPHEGCPSPSPFEKRYWPLRLTTQVQPTYFVVTSPQDWLDPKPVVEVEFHAWFPASRRPVWVQRIVKPDDSPR